MTVLQALHRYYDRMAARGEAEAPGWSREKIGFAVVLTPAGEPVDVLDLREQIGKKLQPRQLEVPEGPTRTGGVAANFLWDKTSYVFGRTAAADKLEGKKGKPPRVSQEHDAFRELHGERLAGATDAGLLALKLFLERWTPDRFAEAPFHDGMLDANIVFRLDGDACFLHERAAASALVTHGDAEDEPPIRCLISGDAGAVARLHPAIQGVQGAQSSGALLVSFNLDAFTSYNHEQGDNAPTSRDAAFRYGAALNRLLDRGSANRLTRPIGDATVVFWADAGGAVDEESARACEDGFNAWFGGGAAGVADPEKLERDEQQAARLRDALRDVAAGRPAKDGAPKLAPGVRFHVLGLSPNAARLSIRFWIEDDFSAFARRLLEHEEDLAIEPRPWRVRAPSVFLLLLKSTALMEKAENVPPLLAGEMARAILSGARYPRSLLSAAITRLRAGDDPATGWHAAAIRAVLARQRRFDPATEETPMSLDRENENPAYQLGRMFAALETAQRLALGKVNATIRDRYFAAASATPASVFPLLLRGVQNHLGKLRKEGKGGWIEREIEDITDRLPPELPRSLRLEAQGRFAIGYYHQRKAQFAGRPEAADTDEGDTPHDE